VDHEFRCLPYVFRDERKGFFDGSCRISGGDENEGQSDCQRVADVEDWLQLDIMVGDELGIWPEGMPVPPLPEGMEWEKVRDPNIGEYYWVVVVSE